MVRIVSYFTYYFSNSLGSLGAHFSRVPAPTWVNFPSPVNVELLPLKNGRVFLIWVSKLRTELVLIPSRWYELFPILNIIFQTVWGHSEPISISRVPAPTWALWMDYVSPHTMFAKTFLHFENHLWKMIIFKGSATNRSQNVFLNIFMPLMPVFLLTFLTFRKSKYLITGDGSVIFIHS
jgi:hypothetical protein